MQKPVATLFSAAVLLALVGTILITTSHPVQGAGNGGKPAQDVLVVNTATEPVPVTGEVALKPGSKVGIDPSGNGVTVVNGASQPIPVAGNIRDADQPARQPFAHSFSNNFTSGVCGDDDNIVVPSGKRLVIETVSGQVRVPSGQTAVLTLGATTSGVVASYPVPITFAGSNLCFDGQDSFRTFEALRIYADPGSTVIVEVRRNSNTGPVSWFLTISGYLVDLP